MARPFLPPRLALFALVALVAGCASAPQPPASTAPPPAQAAPPPQPPPPAKAVARPQAAPVAASALTTLAGVYTMDQAKRGADVYSASCGSCHSPASQTGNSFKAGWGGRPLSELFNYVSSEMPQNDPGSLDPQQYVDVTAYLLRLNAMPAGNRELPANVDSLAKIQVTAAPPSSPGTSPLHH